MIAVFDKEESLRACLASILEIDFNLIPKQKNDKFENDINEFLIKEHGIFMAPCSFNFRKNNNIKYFNSTFLIGFKKIIQLLFTKMILFMIQLLIVT